MHYFPINYRSPDPQIPENRDFTNFANITNFGFGGSGYSFFFWCNKCNKKRGHFGENVPKRGNFEEIFEDIFEEIGEIKKY